MLRDTISLQASLEKSPLVDRLLPLARQQKLYLVGGAVRDGLSGLVVKDLDVISPTDPTDLARTFARDIGGHWFWLDEARQQSRVVVDHQKLSRHFDFAPFRGDGIEADLCDRDFTVNAMAIALEKGGLGATLIDPCDGAADLRQKILRMGSPEAGRFSARIKPPVVLICCCKAGPVRWCCMPNTNRLSPGCRTGWAHVASVGCNWRMVTLWSGNGCRVRSNRG
ncbi:MAG: hypothetical protein P8Y96_12580 [Desulfuromonadales bacterium]